MNERRKHERFELRRKIFSQKTGELLGYAENISLNGINISSVEPIPDNEEILIRFGGTKESKKEKSISLAAYKNWSGFSDTLPRLYYSGLHFINPSRKDLDSIQELIDGLSG